MSESEGDGDRLTQQPGAENGDSLGKTDDKSNGGPPQIRNHPGRWDEALAGLVVAAPFALLLGAAAVMVGLIAIGAIRVDLALSGRVDAMALLRPLVLPAGALIAGSYLLFAMKFFGVQPVTFVLDLLDGYERER